MCHKCKKHPAVDIKYAVGSGKIPLCQYCIPAVEARYKQWLQWHNQYRRNRKPQRAAEARNHRAKHKEQHRAYKKRYYEKNKKRLQEYRRQYIKNNPWFNRAAASRHRALIFQRTPKWADIASIKQVFKECPKDKVVDHIIPLRGKNVCGLHVHWNLQYLTFEENSRKSNRF